MDNLDIRKFTYVPETCIDNVKSYPYFMSDNNITGNTYTFNLKYTPIDPEFIKKMTYEDKPRLCDYKIGADQRHCKNKSKLVILIKHKYGGTVDRVETIHVCKKHFNKMIKLKK